MAIKHNYEPYQKRSDPMNCDWPIFEDLDLPTKVVITPPTERKPMQKLCVDCGAPFNAIKKQKRCLACIKIIRTPKKERMRMALASNPAAIPKLKETEPEEKIEIIESSKNGKNLDRVMNMPSVGPIKEKLTTDSRIIQFLLDSKLLKPELVDHIRKLVNGNY
jgi:hypothetical protein